MKLLIFIVSFILSCFFNSGGIPVQEHCERLSSATVETAPQHDNDSEQAVHSNAILPVRAARLAGENTGSAPTLRSNSSLRRAQISQKHPFRIIKAGKIIDRQTFYVFRTILLLFPSGINAISRYIHIICQLLI